MPERDAHHPAGRNLRLELRVIGGLQDLHRRGRRHQRHIYKVCGERLVGVLYLLGEAGKGLQFVSDGNHCLGIDALVNRTVFLESSLAVEARIPDQEYRLPALCTPSAPMGQI